MNSSLLGGCEVAGEAVVKRQKISHIGVTVAPLALGRPAGWEE